MANKNSKENKVIMIRTYHILSDYGGNEGPNMAREVGEGEAPGAKGGGEQLRGVNVQDLQWEWNYTNNIFQQKTKLDIFLEIVEKVTYIFIHNEKEYNVPI